LLTVVRPSAPDRDRALADAQAILGGALTYALAQGEAPEALLTVADSPWDEIPRVARSRRCAALVLGMTALDDRVQGGALERLLNELPDVDVAVLHAPAGWAPEAARRIMIPLGGQGTHDAIRARVLGSLLRTDTDRQVTFVRCVPEDDGAALAVAERTLADAAVGIPGSVARVLPCTDPTAALIAEARNHDLVLLGLSRHGRSRAFGAVTLPIAASAGAALMLAGADSGPGLLAQVGWPGGR
ncbi:MAG: hypothetical protein KC613_17450, partial [Myxococcales bacterium]|nr:hypothetical protein [Myxococcales bacterium]